MRKNFLWSILLINLIVLPLLYWRAHPAFFHGGPSPTATLPVYGQMPSFQLTRENGEAFNAERMKGAIWVANFIFTRCPNQCPMMSAKFGTLQNNLPEDTRLASFSVDPEYDTPRVLSSYAQDYHADTRRWFFLTGDHPTILRIMDAVHLGTESDPGMHSLRFVLLDKQLRVRGYYDSQDNQSLARLRPDIEQLRKER